MRVKATAAEVPGRLTKPSSVPRESAVADREANWNRAPKLMEPTRRRGARGSEPRRDRAERQPAKRGRGPGWIVGDCARRDPKDQQSAAKPGDAADEHDQSATPASCVAVRWPDTSARRRRDPVSEAQHRSIRQRVVEAENPRRLQVHDDHAEVEPIQQREDNLTTHAPHRPCATHGPKVPGQPSEVGVMILSYGSVVHHTIESQRQSDAMRTFIFKVLRGDGT